MAEMTSLPSLNLDAFVAVAQTRHFSKAAERLHITQSAISQRVLNLERELEATLLIRDRSGVRLTELGETLLRFCRNKGALESEFLERVRARGRKELRGELRVGGFSSVMRSVILPALAPLIRANPGIRLNLMTRETRELPDLLMRGEIDFMILDRRTEREGIEAVDLGREVNVLVRSTERDPGEIYLDHDEEDRVTFDYLKAVGKSTGKVERRYLDDVYGVIDGVRNGLGRAVVPRHLIAGQKGLSIIDRRTALEVPVLLHYFTQPYYTELQTSVIEALSDRAPDLLKARS